MSVKIISVSRIFPSAEKKAEPTITKLSVLDSYAANFNTTGALWFFEHNAQPQVGGESLKRSLTLVLDQYAHFSGRIRRAIRSTTSDKSGDETRHYNRHDVWWGDDRAPGVEFMEAVCSERLDSFTPSTDEQGRVRFWRSEGVSLDNFLMPERPFPSGMTAPYQDGEEPDPPCVIVQVTSLACGGIVVAAKLSHLLGDASTLGHFMKDWSRMHTVLSSGEKPPVVGGVLENLLVDNIAEKPNITKEERENLLKEAYSLPFHRYDWYSNQAAPFESPAASPPTALANTGEAKTLSPRSKHLPWEDWNVAAPVGFSVIQFTPDHLERLRTKVVSSIKNDPKLQHLRVPSTLDIIMAHLWSCVNRARGFNETGGPEPSTIDGDQVYVDMTIGLRARLSPPLPDAFLGNPLAIVATGLSQRDACTSAHVPAMASALRSTLQKVTAEGLEAHLFSLTQELTPQRIWQTFLGKRHLLVTSWVHSGVSDIDFGSGCVPVFVHPIMPLVDGCVELIESPRTGEVQNGAKWYDQGLRVNLYLEREAMDRLEKDPELLP